MTSGRVKQSKAISAVGFLVGLLFVAIGIAGVTPTFGFFGIVWTAVAGIIAAYHGYALFSDRGASMYEIQIDQGKNGVRTIDERLRELEGAKNKGIITDVEYQTQRAKIISEI